MSGRIRGEERPGGSQTPRTTSPWKAATDYTRMGQHSRRYLFAGGFVRGRRVLDFGCGHGLGRLLLPEGMAKYVGVDSDGVALAWASTHIAPVAPGGATFLKSLDAIPAGERFDVIIAFEVVEHVSDPTLLLQNLLRLLAPGGCLLLSTPNGAYYDATHGNPFHVTEYRWAELSTILGQLPVRVTYFRQRRVDFLDVLGLRLSVRLSPSGQQSVGSSAGGITGGFRAKASTIYQRWLNGPMYWRVIPSSPKEMNRAHYSTIVVMCRPVGPV